MNQITLYRKGGRKPWVFTQRDYEQRAGITTFCHTTVKGTKYIIQTNKFNNKPAIRKFFNSRNRSESWGGHWYDIKSYKIHADHFTLGNCKITF